MSTVIETKDLTESVDGSGVFDTLMASLKDHLQVEFERGRITGVNYSNVYLGGLTVVMQQSIEFLLRKDQSARQADLITAQIANTEADTLFREKQTELAEVQIDIALKDLLIKDKELQLAEKEIQLKTAQVQIAEKEVELKEQELLVAQEQVKKIAEEVKLLAKQVIKTDSEIAVLNAKAVTEQGQTSDSINAGLVGAQRRLYEAQTQGFTNDHNYKMTKTRADIYSVMLSQDPDALWNNPPPNWVLG